MLGESQIDGMVEVAAGSGGLAVRETAPRAWGGGDRPAPHRRHRVLVDLPAQPPVQVCRFAGELEPVPGPDEVGFCLGLVLPADHHAPLMQRRHPTVDVEDAWVDQLVGGLAICCHSYLRPHSGEQVIASHPGQ